MKKYNNRIIKICLLLLAIMIVSVDSTNAQYNYNRNRGTTYSLFGIKFKVGGSSGNDKDYDFNVDGIYYKIISSSDKTIAVACKKKFKRTRKYKGDIIIPQSVQYKGNTYSVTSIGEYAFNDCEKLTSITIPNSVTSIGEHAFSGCYNLSSITIPNSVTSIGDLAFEYCYNLTSITIPNSVTSIGWGAFWGCDKLASITIPNSVTSIGELAFNGCDNLTSITIPNSVTSIGELAFNGCDNLTSITIPNSVKSIGKKAFADCYSLTSISIPNSVISIGEKAFDNTSWYKTQQNGILYLDDCCLGYKGAEPTGKLTFKKDTRLFIDKAFYGCRELSSITIPNSVEVLGDSTFYGCRANLYVTEGYKYSLNWPLLINPIHENQLTKKEKKILTRLINNMIYVEGGCFRMGTSGSSKEEQPEERPVHKVYLDSYYISKYEVSQEEWITVMGENPSYFDSDLSRPVENVSWHDCIRFIRRLRVLTGINFNLPTEAQWEYAARGGQKSKNYKYIGTNNYREIHCSTSGWYQKSSTTSTDSGGEWNELGIGHMGGNVREWCLDYFGKYSDDIIQINPKGPQSGSTRVIRGGAWNKEEWICRAGHRYHNGSNLQHHSVGLRLVVNMSAK